MFAAVKMDKPVLLPKLFHSDTNIIVFLNSYNLFAKNNDKNLVNQYIFLAIHVYITSQKRGNPRFLIHLATAYKTNLLRVKDN